jgi:hypothetical protein
MKKFEYKTVTYDHGIGERLSGNDFGERFALFLTQQGNEGWDLKAIIRESGMHAILIFSREAT